MQILIVIGVVAAAFYLIWLAFFPIMVIKRMDKIIEAIEKNVGGAR